MNTQVLVLSNNPSQSACWVDALKRSRLTAKVIPEWPEARCWLACSTVCVVLYDADCGIAPDAEVLSSAALAKLPVIAMARNPDAAQWLALFKKGAFDVLTLPVPPAQLRDSVEEAVKRFAPGSLTKRSIWLEDVFEWAKSIFRTAQPQK